MGGHQRVRSEFDEAFSSHLGTRLIEFERTGDIGITLENNQKQKAGVLVAGLATDMLAEVAGVRVGDEILSVNSRAVCTAGEAIQLMDNATGTVCLGLAARDA